MKAYCCLNSILGGFFEQFDCFELDTYVSQFDDFVSNVFVQEWKVWCGAPFGAN